MTATVATIINYDCNMFIVQATVATIVDYDCNMFMGRATAYSFHGEKNVL